MDHENLKQKVVLVRHGETSWSLSGQHTSYTDLTLTPRGEEQARTLKPLLADRPFALVLSSPLKRARQTCDITGFGDRIRIDADLTEWNYGRYEGMTTEQIQQEVPHWGIFTHPCPDGESIEQVQQRVDRVIDRIQAVDGDVVVFSHGHVLRVFAARWIGLPAIDGRMFVLDTTTLNVLGAYHEWPAIVTWNSRP